MIRPANASDLSRITAISDPFFTRILSLYESYGEGYDFVAFWVQENDGEITAAISRFEDKFSLYLTGLSDLDEVAAFIRFQGAGSCLYNAAFSLDFPDDFKVIGGQVLQYSGDDYISEKEICEPDFKALYTLLESCASPIFIVPPYLQFLSDLTHRNNREKLHLIATEADGVLSSSVMTVSETAHAAILGAVATHPAYRRRGLSRQLVRTLATRLRREGRAVYVLSASEANTRFYQNSGFTVIADFKEIFPS
ncbi:MAG: GNAT family N-acetyltransferase [Ruminococcus sp.]|nr:GNAT family N-acetyltransferase [Ruminococcus sp.]